MGRKKKEFKINKLTKLKKVIHDIKKQYGNDVITFAGTLEPKERLSFGVDKIDELTGGSICGNFVIIYGGEGVGKSTLALTQIAKVQKIKKTCAYIDLEHSFDIERAEKLGVILKDLVLIKGVDNAEQAMDILIKLTKEKVIDLIIIDSIQAMSPKGEQQKKSGKEKSIESDEMALLARKLGKFFRVASTPVYKGNVSVVLIGQVRTQGIGGFAPRQGLSGGYALKHWAMMTLYMRKGQKTDAPKGDVYIDYEENGQIKQDTIKDIVGFDSVIKIEKTQISNCKPERTEIHLPFYFDFGYNKLKEDKDEL